MRDYRQIPGWLIPAFLIGSAAALAGAYWDDATHTEKGRDSFFIPPHIAIYAGVMLAGFALAAWAFLFVERNGLTKLWSQRPLVLAIVGVGATLAAGPIDNFWHLAFGRDAVLWSPPHVLGIAGTAAIAIAVLVELVRAEQRWALWLRPVAGGLALAAMAVTVMEYDTDVPQFDPVWYLPVLTLASSFALGVVKLLDTRRFSATAAALVHLAFMGAVALFLLALGFDTPKLPLLVVPALALDLLANRRAHLVVIALAFAVALYAAYVPLLNLTGAGVRLDAPDLELGVPLACLAAVATFALICPVPLRRPPTRSALVAGCLAAAFFALTATASAHDPGQGKPAGTVDLSARVSSHHIAVRARPHVGSGVRPLHVVARRAGVTVHGPLRAAGGELVGGLDVETEGRWFVYVELRRTGRTIESWLPVKVGEDQQRFAKPHRFAYFAKPKHSSIVKWTVGVILYVAIVGLLVAVVRLARLTLRQSGSAAPS